MKSSFSNSQGNCVDVVIRPYADEDHVVVTDTKSKTGKGTFLLFTKEEWDAFTLGVQNGELTWDALQKARDAADSPQRIAGTPVEPIPQRRTPENIAYVNGRHDERQGALPVPYERYCRRFGLDSSDNRSRGIYNAYLTGLRAEAHERAMRAEMHERATSAEVHDAFLREDD